MIDNMLMYQFDFAVEAIFNEIEDGLSFDQINEVMHTKIRQKLPHLDEEILHQIDLYYPQWLDNNKESYTIH